MASSGSVVPAEVLGEALAVTEDDGAGTEVGVGAGTGAGVESGAGAGAAGAASGSTSVPSSTVASSTFTKGALPFSEGSLVTF